MQLRPYLVIIGIALALGAAACSPPPEPITLSDGIITIDNQTDREWRNVLITVNDHYRGGAPSLAAGARMNAPLGQFQTAYGQKYVVAREAVVKIEVAATDASGEPVTLLWGERK
jgi:hypothetical protein